MSKSVLRRLNIQLEEAQDKLRNIIDDAENDELYLDQDLLVNKLKTKIALEEGKHEQRMGMQRL